MSASLVRKSLELFKDDIEDVSDQNKGKSKKKQKDPMQLITTNKRGVKRQLMRLKHQHKTKNKTSLKDRKIKSAIEEYRKKHSNDHTDDSVYQLTLLSQTCKPSSSIVDSIIEHHKGRLSKNRPKEDKTEEKSVFSDRDFDRFEEEYFGD